MGHFNSFHHRDQTITILERVREIPSHFPISLLRAPRPPEFSVVTLITDISSLARCRKQSPCLLVLWSPSGLQKMAQNGSETVPRPWTRGPLLASRTIAVSILTLDTV